MVNVVLKNGKEANIVIMGDSGAGKSESLEAFRALSEEYISDMTIIFDDMGVFKNVDGKLVKQVITYSPKEGSEDEVIVSSGLNEEDKIVSNPTPNMKEGMNVE